MSSSVVGDFRKSSNGLRSLSEGNGGTSVIFAIPRITVGTASY